MAIDALRDGYVRLCFDPSLNVFGEQCRVIIEGQYYDPGLGCTVTPDVLRKVTSVRDLDCLFGEGSHLAEAFKVAFSCCPSTVEYFALPRLTTAVVGGVKAVHTLTVTGPALTDGIVDIYWLDARYNISFKVDAGDTAAVIAAELKATIDNIPGFPYTATVAAGVVTLTARNVGEQGNWLNPLINWHGRNNYFPTGVAIAVANTVQGAGEVTGLNLSTVLGECCVCCYAMVEKSEAAQESLRTYLADAWDCTKPQCFGHGYVYNDGTLGQILANDTNSAELSRLAHCDADPNAPYLKVAAYAVQSCCLTADNPEISIQGPQFGILPCVRHPTSCTQCFSFDEQEQLREGGFVVTVPYAGGQGTLTSPMVTNDITNNRFDSEGRSNATFRDTSSRRLASKTAEALATELQKFNGLGFFTRNTNIRPGVRGTNLKLITGALRAYLKSQVGVLFSEFDDLDKDLTVQSDFQVAPKCLGEPGKIHVNLVYRPPVRLSKVQVNAVPKLLDNCN